MAAAVKMFKQMPCPNGYRRDCLKVTKMCLARHIDDDKESQSNESATDTTKRYNMRRTCTKASPTTAYKKAKHRKGKRVGTKLDGRVVVQPISENEEAMMSPSIMDYNSRESEDAMIQSQNSDETEKDNESHSTPMCITLKTPPTPCTPASPKSPNTSLLMEKRNRAMLAREARERKVSEMREMRPESEKDMSPTEETILELDDSKDPETEKFGTPTAVLETRKVPMDIEELQIRFPIEQFQKIKIPGDGFCMVQSVLETLKTNKTKRETLDNMKTELYSNIDEYRQFINTVDTDPIAEMERYIRSGKYTSNLADLVIPMLSNVLNVCNCNREIR